MQGQHRQSGAAQQDQLGCDQGEAKPQREENRQSWWARTQPKDFAINDCINFLAQGSCPWLGAAGLRKLCRAEPWAAAGFAGAAAPSAYVPDHKHLPWQQKATLLVMKDQKFLNPTQVISHISKNQQPCGLSPPLSFWTCACLWARN